MSDEAAPLSNEDQLRIWSEQMRGYVQALEDERNLYKNLILLECVTVLLLIVRLGGSRG